MLLSYLHHGASLCRKLLLLGLALGLGLLRVTTTVLRGTPAVRYAIATACLGGLPARISVLMLLCMTRLDLPRLSGISSSHLLALFLRVILMNPRCLFRVCAFTRVPSALVWARTFTAFLLNVTPAMFVTPLLYLMY